MRSQDALFANLVLDAIDEVVLKKRRKLALIGKIGENISIKRFARFQVGE